MAPFTCDYDFDISQDYNKFLSLTKNLKMVSIVNKRAVTNSVFQVVTRDGSYKDIGV